ncbi:MAG: hypothetical protein JNK99_15625 [Candidatus Accumulibacter sp.]|uniref:hypothetical protein n=1 Tax=Accumulibacter sp. TaxID=2053492 RepID=UPI001A4E49CA|nr:hypothetical protein [Accumulibacter sp.]MBL8396149.1 hypothetical protein [Accumulibacter sp.]
MERFPATAQAAHLAIRAAVYERLDRIQVVVGIRNLDTSREERRPVTRFSLQSPKMIADTALRAIHEVPDRRERHPLSA